MKRDRREWFANPRDGTGMEPVERDGTGLIFIYIPVCLSTALAECHSVSQSRQHLRSATHHYLLLIPRYYRLSTFGRRAFAVAGRRSGTHWQMNCGLNSSNRFKPALKTFLSALEAFAVMRYIN